MYTKKFYPLSLAPEELDAFLARGWYRMGQAIFTCRFVIFERRLYSAVWTRVPLDDYRPRKSLRRLIGRNRARFHTVVRDAVIDEAKERLYQKYRRGFHGRLESTLEASVYDDAERSIFNTREVAIYDGDRLVAFSLFDLGRDSVESIIGVYDPGYSRHSLGFYTMLIEVEHGIEAGLSYFYPGYVVPGHPSMDYKLRVGHVEHFDIRDESWKGWAELEPEELPAQVLQRQLAAAQASLESRGVASSLRLYPAYEASALGSWLSTCLSQPLYVECRAPVAGELGLIVTYDFDREVFRLDRYARIDVSEYFVLASSADDDSPMSLQLLQLRERLGEASSAEEIAETVAQSVCP